MVVEEMKDNYDIIAKLKMSKGECVIKLILEELNIPFEQEKKFNDLKYKSYLRYDFYFEINDIKFAIEFDGAQHAKPIKYFGGEESFKLTQLKDKIKNKYCEDNDIKLLRVNVLDYMYLKKTIIDFLLENQ